jgi:hypothetical protein
MSGAPLDSYGSSSYGSSSNSYGSSNSNGSNSYGNSYGSKGSSNSGSSNSGSSNNGNSSGDNNGGSTSGADGETDPYALPDIKQSETLIRSATGTFVIPLTLTLYQMWGPTLTVFFFLGVLVFVLMWLYINLNFNSYQDRITVLSLGNLFNQDPQQKFQKYIQQTTQESIAAAMQDIQTSGSNVQTTVNRLQTQLDVNQTQQQGLSKVLQSVVDNLKTMLSSTYLSGHDTVKTTASPPPS